MHITRPLPPSYESGAYRSADGKPVGWGKPKMHRQGQALAKNRRLVYRGQYNEIGYLIPFLEVPILTWLEVKKRSPHDRGIYHFSSFSRAILKAKFGVETGHDEVMKF
jgi:hypothetical protein